MVTILQKENKILRQKAQPVPIKEIKEKKIKKVVEDMKNAMHPIEDAVAIAAPQIGISLRIFVVSGKVFAHQDGNKEENLKPKTPDLKPDLVCINPEIIKRSKKIGGVEEGCLSIRWLYGDVQRAAKVTLRAYDENGKKFTRGASGLLAQIFQHETDHLDGILFIDKAKNMKEMRPKENNLHR